MMEPSPRHVIDTASAFITFLVGRLIVLAAGPELRISYAIAQAARRACRNSRMRSGKW
ncbi:MAG TPA: hypothetical protein VHB49_12010 [Bradyrhizobium sp.]|nr:hypothetical protein [Bradyrhizobium sp.]